MTLTATNEKIKDEVANCGKPLQKWDTKTGRMRQIIRRCKRWNDCPKCAEYKKSLVREELISYVGSARFLIVPKEDEKKYARKFDMYRRVAISDTHTAFVVESDDTSLGNEFTGDNLKLVVDCCLPQNGRRISGKLGIKPAVVEEEEFDWDKMEQEINDPQLEIHYREFRIDFEENESGPKDYKELEALVQEEVDLPYSPTTEGELQEAMYVLEMTTRKICERNGMSFSFLDKKISYIRISEVRWEWLPNVQLTTQARP